MRSLPSSSRSSTFPVIASGDITSRARAQAVLATDGAAAVMVGRGRQGNPWALAEIVDGDAERPSREEVVAELVLFVRETVRELGERRAGGSSRSSTAGTSAVAASRAPFKQELVVLDATVEVERRLLPPPPGAYLLRRAAGGRVPPADEITLALPISIYGGG